MNPADLYHRVREAEGRIYPDEIVANLPVLPTHHPQRGEWLARADSSQRLLRYIVKLRPPLRILEVGCGNGWLSHQISTIPGVYIWGLDRGGPELTQADRLFGTLNTGFLSADIFRPPFISKSFDMIVMASVIQYFPDLPGLIQSLTKLLTRRGEFHLLDSPLYAETEISSARERTRAYYAELEIPEMADHYYHHSFPELSNFSVQWLYRPDKWQARLLKSIGKSASPFPWLSIRQPS